MHFAITAGLLASTAAAFTDSSPFVLFSTSKLSLPSKSTPQLQSTSQVLQTTQDFLASCPTSRYVLISQPNVHASDLRDSESGRCLAPQLCAKSAGRKVQGRLDVAEVVGGDMSMEELSAYVRAACHEQGKQERMSVEEYRLEALPARNDKRSQRLANNDVELGKIMDRAEASGDEYTVIYFSSPHELKTYESEYAEPAVAPMELKRRSADVVGGKFRRQDEGNSSAPLFVKYQFFTPGIFMGLVAGIIMIAILYVGISAVSSLQVSYGAFDKEMGPAAQKKNL